MLVKFGVKNCCETKHKVKYVQLLQNTADSGRGKTIRTRSIYINRTHISQKAYIQSGRASIDLESRSLDHSHVINDVINDYSRSAWSIDEKRRFIP